MKMPGQGKSLSPLFSIEQIELLRRLRNSGITKQQVVDAFDSFDRIDQELGQLYNIPKTIQNGSGPDSCGQNAVASLNSPISIQPKTNNIPSTSPILQTSTKNSIMNSVTNSVLPLAQIASPLCNLTTTNPSLFPSPSINTCLTSAGPVFPQMFMSPHMNEGRGQKRSIDDLLDITEMKEEPLSSHTGNRGRPRLQGAIAPFIMGQSPEKLLDVKNVRNEPEFQQFLEMPREQKYEEIRSFVVRNSLKQQQIATMIGISQAYISKFMSGNYAEMSERCRTLIYTWYYVYKTRLFKATDNHGKDESLLVLNQTVMSNWPGQTSDNQMFQKRDRFVFNDKHLEVLEFHFKRNQYPSQDIREEIAEECNVLAGERYPEGQCIPEKEKVTASVVANWFNNKRKDMKKLIANEGTDISMVPKRKSTTPQQIHTSYNQSICLDSSYENQSGDPDQILADEFAAVSSAICALTGETDTSSLSVKEEPPS